MRRLPILLAFLFGLGLISIAAAAEFEPPIDTRERFTYFYQSAQEGNLEATYEAAQAYLRGNGVDRNIPEGLALMKIAAANLYPEHYLTRPILNLYSNYPQRVASRATRTRIQNF